MTRGLGHRSWNRARTAGWVALLLCLAVELQGASLTGEIDRLVKSSPAAESAFWGIEIVEVDSGKHVVWQYFTDGSPKSNAQPLPTRAVRLRNGDTLISDQFNQRVIEVNQSKQIVRSFGKLNVLGYDAVNVAHGGLNSPYDAKRVGDYTGLTPPFIQDPP